MEYNLHYNSFYNPHFDHYHHMCNLLMQYHTKDHYTEFHNMYIHMNN